MEKNTLTSLRLVLCFVVSVSVFIFFMLNMADRSPVSIIIFTAVSLFIGSIFKPSLQDIEELKIWMSENKRKD